MTNSVSRGIWQNPNLIGRIVELDGVRGLVILLVLLDHYVYAIAGPEHPGSLLSYALMLLRHTWSGVDLFFVLSGFLIGGILIEMKSASNFYRVFYLRRAFRIFPLYYLLLVSFPIAGMPAPLALNPEAIETVLNSRVALGTYPVFVQNIAMSLKGNFGALWLTPTWSLAVEEQFYLLLPIVV